MQTLVKLTWEIVLHWEVVFYLQNPVLLLIPVPWTDHGVVRASGSCSLHSCVVLLQTLPVLSGLAVAVAAYLTRGVTSVGGNTSVRVRAGRLWFLLCDTLDVWYLV